MRCPDQGTWQAYLDDEVEKFEKREMEDHIGNCRHCQTALQELQDLETWTGQCLTGYQQSLENSLSKGTLQQASQSITHATMGAAKQKVRGYWMTNKLKKWTVAAASVLVLTGMLSITPVQEALADFLSIFRVQKIETVKITPAEMEQMAQAIETKMGEVDLKQFGKIDVAQKPTQVKTSLGQAQKELPFSIKQPNYLPQGFSQQDKVMLSKEGKAELQLNVAQVNNLLKSLGSKTLLPEALEGKAFNIAVPAGVRLDFKKDEARNQFTLSQFATPEVVVPAGVDARDLRAALLDLPILPSDFRQQLASIDDWQNTMIVPDTGEGKMEKLNIAGHEAFFTENMNGFSNLLWVDNGLIYNLHGFLAKDDAVKVAESLY